MRWLGIRGFGQKTQRGLFPDGNSARVSSVPRRHLWMPLETLIVSSTEKFARRRWRGELRSRKTCGATQDAGDETEMPSSVNFPPEEGVMLVQLLLLAVSDLGNWKLGRHFKISRRGEKDNKSIIFHKNLVNWRAMAYKTAKFARFTSETEPCYYAIFDCSGAHACSQHKEHRTV